MKLLLHDQRKVKYKPLWLDSKKVYFLVSWMNVVNMAILSVFLSRKCLGPLGVNFQDYLKDSQKLNKTILVIVK